MKAMKLIVICVRLYNDVWSKKRPKAKAPKIPADRVDIPIIDISVGE